MGYTDHVAHLKQSGILPARWAEAFMELPRAAFLPDTLWTRDRGRPWEQAERAADPERWQQLADSPDYLVTQLDDGHPGGAGEMTSSQSAPRAVAEMLAVLDLEPGMRVCEAGTGTGWTAALMERLAGPGSVTTIEIDPQVALTAQTRLHAVGAHPYLVTGDARDGCPDRAPFDRFISTVAVRRIPPAWIAQTRPGGVIVTPFHTPLAGYGLLRLTVADDERSASGAFVGRVAFMWLRAERPGPWPDPVEVPRAGSSAIDPALVAQDIGARFAVGLRLPDVAHRWSFDAGERHETLRVRVWDDHGSRAVAFCNGPRTVYEAGPRDLWQEIEDAHTWWTEMGQPDCEDFRLAADTDGAHRAWTTGDPDGSWSLTTPVTRPDPVAA
ncbi:protein-L-isoaspartate O-methyltransferase family protein [Streptomyces albipurpureus]|uniref:Protein-L-isoaspartate O-methyltransferase n=1 Tax=Streptomyces albipurpureus TaxID=2897419 RepID=A0ABT0UZN4_9ACTN|nr:protein-L-isoaspartate(D-aspartate) O-methyltransferase [Streptomyces sp. CWNU-1]MCM2393929.1 protein-L-isoaspartate(D-aspartate) O-methyltransferase [Streptomyces sp. CWNU-1]